ncbi:radical SAM/SPASM domain-containing protein [Sporomusa sp. KB1]|uniref:radical SAM/SPASM domain-containing protein n=1 Tax=Sporomusa sp. KB1 TaxID=943346 RepID=UPI0011AC5FA8|nr:radical SAM protein [Sporomusa sp. KB1]TWH49490.1 radical SAM protein with 4Fe4S-binding SPASM domain [Sporomusa sp. KB1]
MEYKPVTAVWEITMGCNMRCKHCGSSCKEPLPDELNTEEALGLCDEIGALGLKWITLSGGEPLTRKDWPLLAQRLRQNNVIPDIITNAWMVTEDTVDMAKASGIGTFAISLDGLKETHDFMRKEGSFDQIMAALDLLKKKQMTAGIITTISKKNLPELQAVRDILISKGVTVWQIQIGLPMGNFSNQNDMLIQPDDIDKIIDFSFETSNDSGISIYPADCIGYYNQKEIQVRSKAYRSSTTLKWEGCTAGKRSFGILHNGDILGCTSIRDRQFIEGNIRTTSLTDIWNDKEHFQWSRKLKKESLAGLCRICQYGDTCLGGCPNTRLTLNGGIYSENTYCSYNAAINKAVARVQEISEAELASLGKKFAHKGNWQLAEILMAKVIEKNPHDIDALNYYGYTNFMLGNYKEACQANEKVLAIDPQNAYAYKGLGLSRAKLGELEEGIGLLKKSTHLAEADYMDTYYDLAVLLYENGKLEEARAVLNDAVQKSEAFAAMNSNLCRIISHAEQTVR